VVVSGRLQYRAWESQDGEKRSAVEIEADEIGPSLRWATAKIERNPRSSGASTGGDWGDKVAAPVGGPSEETPLDAG
jgi:single-strand DNA-binding protein